ncbi:MAG: hypothetical protein PHF36_08180 [Candidatus Cloacimonetes bacterium]|nr:hypothetical protein [Candidatus Cloacimonadota bacterium]
MRQMSRERIKKYSIHLLMKNDVPIIGTIKTVRTSISKAHSQGSMLMESYNQTRKQEDPEAIGWRVI